MQKIHRIVFSISTQFSYGGNMELRPKRKIILFPEMRMTRKIFTRTVANLH